jgi:hypothetical protein
MKPSFFREKMKPLSKYKAKEAFIKNTKSGVKPSFFREKRKIAKPSSKYEAKVRSLHQNMKSKKPSSEYEVWCETFVCQRKNETFIKIQSLV